MDNMNMYHSNWLNFIKTALNHCGYSNIWLLQENITKTGWKIGFRGQIDVKTNLFKPGSQTSGIQTHAPITVSSKPLSLSNHILQNLIVKTILVYVSSDLVVAKY